LGKKKKSLLRAFWEKVPELKEIETLGGSIEKIETLVAELKIVVNFGGLNNTFSLSLFSCHVASITLPS
jgi:hypothetical protein